MCFCVNCTGLGTKLVTKPLYGISKLELTIILEPENGTGGFVCPNVFVKACICCCHCSVCCSFWCVSNLATSSKVTAITVGVELAPSLFVPGISVGGGCAHPSLLTGTRIWKHTSTVGSVQLVGTIWGPQKKDSLKRLFMASKP